MAEGKTTQRKQIEVIVAAILAGTTAPRDCSVEAVVMRFGLVLREIGGLDGAQHDGPSPE